MQKIVSTELILTSEGRIYHLNLKPGDAAENIILVGDPQRVPIVSSFFDTVEGRFLNREIQTHTGHLNGQRVSVISTGMGPDNIDIVINELDALFNMDFKTGKVKDRKTTLNIVRIGTSGAMQKDIPVNSFVVSSHGVGLDGLIYFYHNFEKIIDKALTGSFRKFMKWPEKLAVPYIVEGSDLLIEKIGDQMIKGITVTSPGFYGPQGRSLRMSLANPEINAQLSRFRHDDLRICNYEMETAALYGLSRLLGHNAATACLILANRITGEHSGESENYMKKLIEHVLAKLTD
jgi:uridine phosphorylase